MTIPVTVDNTKPKIKIIHPEDKAVYIKEIDEYINIQVDVIDNMAMDRVEFYVDDQKVGESRVAPYSLAYTLVMTDARPSIVPPVPSMDPGELTLAEGDHAVVWRKTVEHVPVPGQTAPGQRIIYTREIGSGETISRTVIIEDSAGITVTLPSGWGAMWVKNLDPAKDPTAPRELYTETHRIHAVAFDAAGNEQKSEPITVWVAHKPPDKKDKNGKPAATPAPDAGRPTGWLDRSESPPSAPSTPRYGRPFAAVGWEGYIQRRTAGDGGDETRQHNGADYRRRDRGPSCVGSWPPGVCV